MIFMIYRYNAGVPTGILRACIEFLRNDDATVHFRNSERGATVP